MIQIFADEDPSVQTHGGEAAVDDRRWNRRCSDGLAGSAGVLRTDMTMHKETGGFDVELFTHVFADLSEFMSALAAGARFRFMAMFNTR